MSFAPHPELLEHARGSRVPRLERADEPMEAERLERKGEKRSGRLRRVAATLVARMDDEAELALLVLLARPLEREVGGIS